MARPDCPRCGSDLVVAALPGSPSEWVEELRGGNVRARPVGGGGVIWLCRSCGHRWDPDADPDPWFPAPSDPLPDPVEELVLQLLPDSRDRRGLKGGAMALVAVAALLVIALLPPRSAPDVEPVEPPEASGAAVRAHDSGRVLPPPAAPERRGVRAVLHVRQPCWVHVLADAEVVASITLVPGETVVYRADRDLQLTLGNAGGVKLRVNDEQVRTGSPGEVVVLDLSWQRGEVLIERG
jgi:hypothetical protein